MVIRLGASDGARRWGDGVRLLRKLIQACGEECVVWPRSRTDTGYGIVSVRGKPKKAHRLAYELAFGEIPTGKVICHACDNRLCVNPNHLWAGTLQENNADMARKGRARTAKGSDHKLSKLSESQATEIKRDSRPERELSRIYGVSGTVVGAIRRGKAWKHV